MLLFHKQDSLDELFSHWLHFATVVRTEIGKLVFEIVTYPLLLFSSFQFCIPCMLIRGFIGWGWVMCCFDAIFSPSSSLSMSHVLHVSQKSIPSMHLSSKWADGDTWLSPQPGLDVLGCFFFSFWESQSLPSRRICIHPLQPSLLLHPQLDSGFDNSKRSASAEYTIVSQRILPSFRGPRNISSILLGAHSSIPTSKFAVNSWPWPKWPSELVVRGRGNLHQQYHSVLLNANSTSRETRELMEAGRTQKSSTQLEPCMCLNACTAHV